MAANITKTFGVAMHLPVKNGASVQSAGDIIEVGAATDLVVVLLKDAAANETDVPAVAGGVEVSYAKLTTDDYVIGDKIYYDAGNDRTTLTSTSNTYCGKATENTVASAATAKFWLNAPGASA